VAFHSIICSLPVKAVASGVGLNSASVGVRYLNVVPGFGDVNELAYPLVRIL
jgi:hypothetical protein